MPNKKLKTWNVQREKQDVFHNSRESVRFQYHILLRDISIKYDFPLEKVIAVFASLSPNTDYFNNLRSCVTVLNAFKQGYSIEQVKVSSYNHCRNRAFTYLNGVDFLATVKGKKITNFYLNLLNPMDRTPVTIDGHAFNIWRGEQKRLQNSLIKPNQYDEIADGYREVAKIYGLIPNQVQAITWLSWKWKHNLRTTKRQLELFNNRQDDIHKTVYQVDDIKPYELVSSSG